MIVVDASVFFAAAIRNGRTRRALLETDVALVAPPRLWEEVIVHKQRIVHLSGTSADDVDALLGVLSTRVVTAQTSWY